MSMWIGAYVSIIQVNFPIYNAGKGLVYIGPPFPKALYLRAPKSNPGLEGLFDVVSMAGLAVLTNDLLSHRKENKIFSEKSNLILV